MYTYESRIRILTSQNSNNSYCTYGIVNGAANSKLVSFVPELKNEVGK
jgi:hypothetical protein